MGRFTVRLPNTLHHELESRAQHEGVSLNQYVVYALTQKIAPAYTIQAVSESEIQQQSERFNTLLKQLGPPDLDTARAYLATREVVKLEDPETAALIARVEEKIAALDSAQE